jgi:hypothetical protein
MLFQLRTSPGVTSSLYAVVRRVSGSCSYQTTSMASAISNLNGPQQLRPSRNFPARQSVFFVSGCLAGIATLPVESIYARLSSSSRLTPLSSHLPKAVPAATTIFRAGTRFVVFDIARTILDRNLPSPRYSNPKFRTSIIGGLSGASGGFAEVLISSLLSTQPRLPTSSALAAQSSRLFFCFGTYTFISNMYMKDYGLPPRPFPVALAMGATAGGIGIAIAAAIEGARGSLLRSSALKGALVIGTVISVHVTTCANMLERLDR